MKKVVFSLAALALVSVSSLTASAANVVSGSNPHPQVVSGSNPHPQSFFAGVYTAVLSFFGM